VDDDALFDPLPESEVAQRLIPYLCETSAAPSLRFKLPPTRMLGGFDTLVYAFELHAPPPPFDGPLVLRVYRDAYGPERARREACIQNAVEALGFPTPRVLVICADRRVLGGAFQIMRRLPGRVMLHAMFGPRVLRMPAVLAGLQARLHGLDANAFVRRLEAEGCALGDVGVTADLRTLEQRIATADLVGLGAAIRWAQHEAPGPPAHQVVCHGDFHPLNVLLDGGAVSGVLDWAWARLADPAWDVGATVALMAHGPLALPAVLQRAVRAVRQWLIERYLQAYATLRPLDRAAVRYYEAVRCLGMLVEAGEHIQSTRRVISRIAKPTAFTDARTLGGLNARFRAIAGIDAALPGA
jgi:aminoglycoside phosphotransferase (APT) family kinase protein